MFRKLTLAKRDERRVRKEPLWWLSDKREKTPKERRLDLIEAAVFRRNKAKEADLTIESQKK